MSLQISPLEMKTITMSHKTLFSTVMALLVVATTAWECPIYSRRAAMAAPFAAGLLSVAPAFAEENEFEFRNRQGNKNAVIRDDYWYIYGKTPPRSLKAPLPQDDPQFNAFGSCTSSDSSGGNSCTYVALTQRIPAYSKYGSSIAYGGRDFQRLGDLLQRLAKKPTDQDLWIEASRLVTVEAGSVPPPIVDSELKMVLLATALTTSPNFPGPNRELLVARFYSNECHQAHRVLQDAIATRDIQRAVGAWEFGRDSWNSYFQVVNRSISPKVGDKFVAIK